MGPINSGDNTHPQGFNAVTGDLLMTLDSDIDRASVP